MNQLLMPQQNLTNFTKGVSWQSLNFGIKAILNIIFIISITRILDQNVFGEYAILSIILIFATAICEAGFAAAIVHFNDVSNKYFTSVVLCTVLFNVFVFLILLFSARKLSSLLGGYVDPKCITFLSLNILFLSLSALYHASLMIQYEFKSITLASLVSFFIGNFIIALPLALLGFEIWSILIGLAVPAITVFGVFNLKGLVFTSLYFASVLAALIFGFLLKLIFKRKNSSELLIELPHYKMPQLKDVLIQMWNKTKSFVLEAGKIILIISMILWFLGSFGPGEAMLEAENEARIEAETGQFSPDERDSHIGSKKLEASYAGIVGKWMEPVIEPLGYDWKIGIALLASFAAREVFVGTMATIYSMGDNGNEDALQTRLSNEINQKTGKPVFNFATSMSLLVFFLLAMQCMSTLAIVKRETGTWKWPILQFIGMSALAYIAAFLVYQYLS